MTARCLKWLSVVILLGFGVSAEAQDAAPAGSVDANVAREQPVNEVTFDHQTPRVSAACRSPTETLAVIAWLAQQGKKTINSKQDRERFAKRFDTDGCYLAEKGCVYRVMSRYPDYSLLEIDFGGRRKKMAFVANLFLVEQPGSKPPTPPKKATKRP